MLYRPIMQINSVCQSLKRTCTKSFVYQVYAFSKQTSTAATIRVFLRCQLEVSIYPEVPASSINFLP